MRTADQISNLRKVFFVVYGSFALFCPDRTIDLLANRLQDEVDKTSGKWTWEIRVITATDFECDWPKIEPEPSTPYCDAFTIKKSCKGLLQKYPKIISILVVAKEDPKMVFQFGS